MRDPNRIDEFCGELARIWHGVPDWRFGQLISNVFNYYSSKTNRDIFFLGDDEMMLLFKKYFGQ